MEFSIPHSRHQRSVTDGWGSRWGSSQGHFCPISLLGGLTAVSIRCIVERLSHEMSCRVELVWIALAPINVQDHLDIGPATPVGYGRDIDTLVKGERCERVAQGVSAPMFKSKRFQCRIPHLARSRLSVRLYSQGP
jgi:hypothetical protein